MGEPRVGSALHVAFLVDLIDPVDLLQSSGRLSNTGFYNDFYTFSQKMITFLGFGPLGALLALRWPHMRSGPPVGLHLEASWSPCWRQDGPSGTKMCPVGSKFGVKLPSFAPRGKLSLSLSLSLSLYIYIYIYIISRSTAKRPL